MSESKHRGMACFGLFGLALSLTDCGDSPPDYAVEWVERVQSEKESGCRARGMVCAVPAAPGASDVATASEDGSITFYFGGEPSGANGYESTRMGQLTIAKFSGDENTMLLTDMRIKVMDNAGQNEIIDFFTLALDQALNGGVLPENF